MNRYIFTKKIINHKIVITLESIIDNEIITASFNVQPCLREIIYKNIDPNVKLTENSMKFWLKKNITYRMDYGYLTTKREIEWYGNWNVYCPNKYYEANFQKTTINN
jgi:hypothetical protein